MTDRSTTQNSHAQPPSSPQAPRKRSGRPSLPPDERGVVMTVRIALAERRAKLRRLGRAWLERAIDRARE